MILYILLAASAMLPAYIITCADRASSGSPVLSVSGTRGRSVSGVCMLILFLLLLVPAALRQATGNDYMRYVEFFHLVQYDLYVPTEAGFNLFVKTIYRLCGYENYILVFALFSAMTTALFLAAIRQQSQHFLASFFLFMMFGYYFQSYNTVRYYFALAIAVFSIRSFLERRYAAFAALILLASTFHKSALIVFVLYPLARHVWTRRQLILAGIFGINLLVLHSFWLKVFVRLYPSWADTDDLAAGTSVSWGNVLRCLMVLTLAVYVKHKHSDTPVSKWTGRGIADVQKVKGLRPRDAIAEICGCILQMQSSNEKVRFYWNCTVIGLAIYICGWFIPEVSRLCYYITFTQIFFIPELLGKIRTDAFAAYRKAQALVILVAVFSFAVFLHNASDPYIKVLPYETYLFHKLPETPSRSIR